MAEFIDIPNPIEPSFRQRVTLDGADYQLDFEWNMRAGWFFAVSDADNVRITSPRQLVVQWDLMTGVVDDRKPPGKLGCFDLSGQYLDPGYEDLGTRCVVIYIPLAEL